ncbi:MAG: hypothetical protein JWO46_594 [Nocardioidaceae bacterium]|nr:hypothetical protein [Nocardioidaceae bacterium]
MTVPVVIDTDPGIDDAIAIMLAAASPEVDVLAITAVSGNVGLDHTTANACALADLVGLDVPVGRGAAGPLWRRDTAAAEDVHGRNGLGGHVLPSSARATEPAVPLLHRVVEDSAEPVTLVTIGPLTNVALLMAAHPETARKIDRIVMMGGAFRALGNRTPTAEFNIWFDPDAAARVVDFGVPITMVGLDVTQQCRLYDADVAPLVASGGPIAETVLAILRSGDADARHGLAAGAMQHDALAMAAVIRPDLLELERFHVDVENAGRLTSGMTVVDHRRSTGHPENVDLAVGVDAPAFLELLVSRLVDLDGRLSA